MVSNGNNDNKNTSKEQFGLTSNLILQNHNSNCGHKAMKIDGFRKHDATSNKTT